MYFPLLILQIKCDIFPLRNRQHNRQYQLVQSSAAGVGTGTDEDEDDLFVFQDYMRAHFEQNCKVFFILRDFYLLTRVQVTGTIVYYIKKDEKHFFGLDDTSGVVTCILWMNQYSGKGGGQGQNGALRSWLSQENIGIGDTISVLAALEVFQDKVQLNVHKMRLIKDSGEEMLQY